MNGESENKNITPIYLIALCLLFVACSKNTPALTSPVQEMFLNKVTTYMDDTSKIEFTDSLEYNEKEQVTKIRTYYESSDGPEYTFLYNEDGDIYEMHKMDKYFPVQNNRDYYFSFNSSKKIDGIKQLSAGDSSHSILKYDSNNQLAEVKTYYNSGWASTSFFQTAYFRSTQLDSIHTDYPESNYRIHYVLETTKIDAKPILAINKAYMLAIADRNNFGVLFYPIIYAPNLFTHQYFNPGELLLKNYTMTYTGITGTPIHSPHQIANTFSLNAAGAVRLYTNRYFNGFSYRNVYTKFDYVAR